MHEASEEQIAMPGEKSLHFLPVSACRGGDTAAGRERTDQPNYQVSLKLLLLSLPIRIIYLSSHMITSLSL